MPGTMKDPISAAPDTGRHTRLVDLAELCCAPFYGDATGEFSAVCDSLCTCEPEDRNRSSATRQGAVSHR